MQLLKQRQNAHAAARAWQRQAESGAAARAAASREGRGQQGPYAREEGDRQAGAAEKAAAGHKAATAGGTAPYTGPIPSSCKEYSGNRAIGCALMLKDGFEIDQFPCLDKLWTKESGWNTKATNSGSGAYGIPQALPGQQDGLGGVGLADQPGHPDQVGPRLHRGPVRLPVQAWSHSESTGWY